jgi:hypothetical protein
MAGAISIFFTSNKNSVIDHKLQASSREISPLRKNESLRFLCKLGIIKK